MSEYTIDIPPHTALFIQEYAEKHGLSLEAEMSKWLCDQVTDLQTLENLRKKKT